ncbi:MAG: hypothetical protein E4H27_04325 [Anaerolineales bacterium]|nr:MAG: hypothetical protein E4H27_04325 [Anaerolineales bacterium]
MKIFARCVSLICVLLAFGCARFETEPQSLVFMAGYKPQADLPFVGVYVAEAKGFFNGENIHVTIQHSAGRGEHLQLLVAGSVDITTQDAAVMLARIAEPGLPLVSIGLIGQNSQQAFVALESSGITALTDWIGRKIGFKGTPPPDLLALLEVAGVKEGQVELINVGFDPRVLVEGLVDVYPVYNSNEPFIIQSWGYNLNQWNASDYGIPTMGLAYVTTPDIMTAKPAAISAFMRAVLRGIDYAEQHPAEAVDIVLAYTGPETDRDHMLFMLETEIKDAHSALTDQYGLGWQTTEQWQALLNTLMHFDAIAGPVDVKAAFTNQFLPNKKQE